VRRFLSALAIPLALAVAAALAPAWAPAWAQAATQAPEKRVALVIGNAAYKEAPLRNPANDARLMAATLKNLGFEVIERTDATRAGMGAALGEFTRRLQPGSVALFYYAGHGIQSRGRNYLIPVDAAPQYESDLRFQAVDVGALTEELDQAQARVSLVVLDACRNNPFEKRMRGAARGLAAVDAARGGLIAYATAPGSVASDGEGANGTYTEELVKALGVPGLKAEEVFKRVTAAVEERTKGQQTPWISSSLRGDFVFNAPQGAAGAAPPPAAGQGPGDREALFWQSAQASNRVEEYREYLKQFPQGTFAGLARARIAGLEAQAKAQAQAQAQAPAKPPQIAAAPARPVAPVIEPIDREYRARESARVREGPDVGARVVGTLQEGEAVQVLGKLKDQNWYQVERPGTAPGFVAAALLEEAASYKKRKAEEEAQQRALAPPPAAAPAPPPRVSLNLEGLYRATGTNPNGTSYSGTCTVTRSGDTYQFYWQVGSTYRGSGRFEGDELVIHWGEAYPVIYTVADDGRLIGTWSNGRATEVLVKMR